MIATDFKPGDRVEMTELAIRENLQGRSNRRTGTVKGHGPEGGIRVQRDGDKGTGSYRPEFWKLMDESRTPGSLHQAGSEFTEPPPDADDPEWADKFTAWLDRKSKAHGMVDALEGMARALGMDSEADKYRQRQQSELRHREEHSNNIYGKTPKKP